MRAYPFNYHIRLRRIGNLKGRLTVLIAYSPKANKAIGQVSAKRIWQMEGWAEQEIGRVMLLFLPGRGTVNVADISGHSECC
jgi:hypothetical protein